MNAIDANTIIIGGGASGLFCAALLKKSSLILERNDRVGRKLSATGNGQGNVTNSDVTAAHYFSFSDDKKIENIINRYGKDDMMTFLRSIGCVVVFDERGRAYPAARQASAVTDLLRYKLSTTPAKTITGAYVIDIAKKDDVFTVFADIRGEKKVFSAKNVIICTGGKAAKNFGSDGNGYELARKTGHSVTPLYPSLVQIKTDTTFTKQLKGIRANAAITAYAQSEILKRVTGDVIFTDYGVSGDAIFRISAFIADKLDKKVMLSIDFLPEISEADTIKIIDDKKKIAGIPKTELLCGMVNNQIGRAVLKRAGNDNSANIVKTLKNFVLSVTGSIGFDYAQVTKGGIPLYEVSVSLESKKVKNLFFAGEILDVDGECGGYNLQWAFSSARIVADAINNG